MTTILLDVDPVHEGRWLASEPHNPAPQLGAHLDKSSSDLTVYWSCEVSRDQMFQIVKAATEVVSKRAPIVKGKFIAYGKDMRAVYTFDQKSELHLSTDGSFIKPDHVKPLEVFNACRAEISASPGTIVVWANVGGPIRSSLAKGGENIGVSVPPDIFEGASKTFIKQAIEMTMKHLKPDTISAVLEKFSQDLVQKVRPAAS